MSIRPLGDGAVPLAEVEVTASPDAVHDDASWQDDADAEVSDQEVREFRSTFDTVKGKRLAVNVVLLKGLQRTKQHIVARELRDLPNADNLDEVKDVLLDAWESLRKLDIFDAVDIVIDQGTQLAVGWVFQDICPCVALCLCQECFSIYLLVLAPA